MNEKLATISHPDDRFEATKLCMERYRRLMNDYEKDEEKIWKEMCRDFRATFRVSEDELEKYMEKCEGTLMDLYNMVKQDYIKRRPDKAFIYEMEN